MAREMKNALEVNLDDKELKQWSVVVQVLHRGAILTDKNQQKYRNYLLTDMAGTKISAVMFNNHIPVFEHSLLPYQRYVISNAQLCKLEERFRVSDYKCSWVIKNRTPVEPMQDPEPHQLPCSFNCVPVSQLYRYADKDIMLGLVIHRFPPAKQTNGKLMKIYLFVDQELIPVLLRLWCEKNEDEHEVENLEKEPVFLVATDMKVSTFYGLSLNSRYNSHLLQEPPMDGITEIKAWYMENKTEISTWKGNRIYHDVGRFFLPPKEEEILDLQTAEAQIARLKTTWVRANIELTETTAKPWYSTCEKCTRFLDTEPNSRTYCNICNEWMITDLRTKLFGRLIDGNINLPTTVSSPDTDYLINMTPDEVHEAHAKGIPLLQKMTQGIRGRKVICFIKTYEPEYKGKKTPTYPTLKLFMDEDLQRLRRKDATKDTNSQPSQATSVTESAQTTMCIGSQGTPESQIFSPTLERVLEKATNQKFDKESSSSPLQGLKRQIQFGNIEENDINPQPAKQSESHTEVLTQSSTSNKKMKEKTADQLE